MGELDALALPPDGYMLEDPLFSPPFISPLLSNPSPTSIGKECWELAEDIAEDIIKLIQPTVESEKKRKGVIEHVQGLIRTCVPGSEVFPFGSVPLKTYLPDGDIDLTALSVQAVEDSLANDVRSVLEREEHNKDTDFEVKDVQYIHAEVKLIKCLVQNIVVDVSFNQLGGLCTLCFLEQVDRLIGKNHLFKRSIILIKAWCYHESRILGAHHGLISTYALETMVLYIFHLFHSSLNGPVAVLYRFLDYYSKFDWDNFCISLYGPVSLASLPEIVAETPDNDGGELLLDKEFLRKCVDMFSVPSRGPDTHSRSFPQKHFNIVDPLKENNNLGRSVSKGNFYRIRSAFTYGARKLGQILLLTVDDIVDELNKFFTNTLERHGSGRRPDVRVFVPMKSGYGSDHDSCESAIDKCTGNKTLLDSSAISLSSTGESGTSPQGLLDEGNGTNQISGLQSKSITGAGREPQRCTVGVVSSLEVLERLGYIKEKGIAGCYLVDDAAADHASASTSDTVATSGMSDCIPEPGELVTSLGKSHLAPHLSLSPPFRENGKIGTAIPDHPKATGSVLLENNMSSELAQGIEREVVAVVPKDFETLNLGTSLKIESSEECSSTVGAMNEPSTADPIDDTPVRATTSLGVPDSLSDLSGDYDGHINSLMCAQWCFDCSFSGPFLQSPPLYPHFQNQQVYDTPHGPMQLLPNVYQQVNANGVFPGLHPFPVHSPSVSGAGYCVEEVARHRGTGTYLPNLNGYGERTSPGRISAPPVPRGQFLRPLRDSNWTATTETHFTGKGRRGPRLDRFLSFPGQAKLGRPGSYQDSYYMPKESSYTNGFSAPFEQLEFGTLGQVPSSVISSEARWRPVSSTHTEGYSPHFPALKTATSPRPVAGVNVEGSKTKAYHLKKEANLTKYKGYHLKNEADFPPLSVPAAK